MPRFCNYCGNIVEPEYDVCQVCGTPINENVDIDSDATVSVHDDIDTSSVDADATVSVLDSNETIFAQPKAEIPVHKSECVVTDVSGEPFVEKSSKKRSGRNVAIIIVVLLVVIGVAVYFLFAEGLSSNNKSDSPVVYEDEYTVVLSSCTQENIKDYVGYTVKIQESQLHYDYSSGELYIFITDGQCKILSTYGIPLHDYEGKIITGTAKITEQWFDDGYGNNIVEVYLDLMTIENSY